MFMVSVYLISPIPNLYKLFGFLFFSSSLKV